MKNILMVIGIFALAFMIFVIADFGRGSVKVYDCGMAEWHPDIPKAVRDECRRIHYEEWKRQQEDKQGGKSLVI